MISSDLPLLLSPVNFSTHEFQESRLFLMFQTGSIKRVFHREQSIATISV